MTFSAPSRDWRSWPAWTRETPGGGRLPLRAFLGVTFVFAALQKLANPAFFHSSNPAGIEAQMRSAQNFSPIGALLGPAVHAAALLGYLIAFAELAVGIGTLLGFRGRTAAAGGMFLSLMFFLTVSWSTTPYYYGADIVFFFAWTPFLISGPGALSLDAWLESRSRLGGATPAATPAATGTAAGPGARARAATRGGRVDRRTAITRFGLTGAVSAVVLAFGGIAAFVGRALSSPAPGGTGGLGTLPGAASGGGGTGNPPSGTGGGGTSTTAGGTARPKGTKIGFVADVPVGQAAPFTLQSVPAYVVRPRADQFLGFSRVCTHEGCTVNYVHSVQQFQCPCHGSVYSALTGEVLGGPAPSPLPKIPIAEGPSGELFAD